MGFGGYGIINSAGLGPGGFFIPKFPKRKFGFQIIRNWRNWNYFNPGRLRISWTLIKAKFGKKGGFNGLLGYNYGRLDEVLDTKK